MPLSCHAFIITEMEELSVGLRIAAPQNHLMHNDMNTTAANRNTEVKELRSTSNLSVPFITAQKRRRPQPHHSLYFMELNDRLPLRQQIKTADTVQLIPEFTKLIHHSRSIALQIEIRLHNATAPPLLELCFVHYVRHGVGILWT